jgi:hypothetical protein
VSKTSETAFPVTDRNGGPASRGMTLRDYFAAAALTGLLNAEWPVGPVTANEAYKAADAMLASRERKEGA